MYVMLKLSVCWMSCVCHVGSRAQMTLFTPRVGSGMRCTGTRREDEEGWEEDEEGWEEDEEGWEEDEEGWEEDEEGWEEDEEGWEEDEEGWEEDEEGREEDEEGWEEDEEGREEDEEGWVWWVDVTAYLSNTALQRTHLPVQSISSLCGLTQAV